MVKKFFLSVITSFLLVFSLLTLTFANNSDFNTDELNPEITNYSSSDDRVRLPNAIPMKVTANSDGTGCKVYV